MWVADGYLALWMLGAPATYRVDPANGDFTEVAKQPVLWSPDGTQRVDSQRGSGTTLRMGNGARSSTPASSSHRARLHIRWAGSNNEIVFTLGPPRSAAACGRTSTSGIS